MACSQARHLQAYLDAELPLPAHARLEAHLRECPTCQAELADLERLQGLLRELAPAAPPATLVSTTMLRARREVARRPAPLHAWASALTAASAAAALLLVVLQMGLPREGAPTMPVLTVTAHTDLRPTSPVLAFVPATPLATAVRPAMRLAAAPALRTGRSARATNALRAVRTVRTAPPTAPAVTSEAVALTAYREAAARARRDPDLSVAALENVALAYPETRQAAKALLAAGNLARRQGNLAEADMAYRRVLALRAQPALSQALAHKALADLRCESVGEDEVAVYHYQQAARALRSDKQSAPARPNPQALVMLADVERNLGQHQRAAADYATAANSTGSAVLNATGEQASTALAEVL